MILNDIVSFIRDRDHFLIAGHINADGDAISASLATAWLLSKLNKSYRLIFHDLDIDRRFDFLEGFQLIESAQNQPAYNAQAAIICDTPTTERIGTASSYLPKKHDILKIDHHPNEESFGALNWVDTQSSSTTCLVFQLIEAFGVEMDQALAQIIMTGLMYDTGRFSYSNTKALDFEIAAKVMNLGANPELSYMKIFCSNSLNGMKVTGTGLSRLETFFEDQLGIIYLDYKTTSKATSGELEELSSYSTSVDGSHVGLFIRETKPGLFKVSLRSRGRVNVNAIAVHFGGGGHVKASGCRIEAASFSEVKQHILDVVESHLIKEGYLIPSV